MSEVYTRECDFDAGSEIILQIDTDGDIWMHIDGDGEVMLNPDSARSLAAELLKFANESGEAKQ